jgi:hypothetical protein
MYYRGIGEITCAPEEKLTFQLILKNLLGCMVVYRPQATCTRAIFPLTIPKNETILTIRRAK